MQTRSRPSGPTPRQHADPPKLRAFVLRSDVDGITFSFKIRSGALREDRSLPKKV